MPAADTGLAKARHVFTKNQRLKEELEKAHIVIDVQKKAAKLLGYPLAEVPNGEQSS